MEKTDFLARQPKVTLLGTPWQKDPTDCRHTLMEFKGTAFVDGRHSHQIVQLFQCQDCGLKHKVPRSVKEAGVSGAVDIDDPRVKRTLQLTPAVMSRLFPFREGRGGTKPEMEIFQVPRSYGGARG
jgi:hypothetical protein